VVRAGAHPSRDAVINLNLKERTDALRKTPTPREERVIKMRFGRVERRRIHNALGPAAAVSFARITVSNCRMT